MSTRPTRYALEARQLADVLQLALEARQLANVLKAHQHDQRQGQTPPVRAREQTRKPRKPRSGGKTAGQ